MTFTFLLVFEVLKLRSEVHSARLRRGVAAFATAPPATATEAAAAPAVHRARAVLEQLTSDLPLLRVQRLVDLLQVLQHRLLQRIDGGLLLLEGLVDGGA